MNQLWEHFVNITVEEETETVVGKLLGILPDAHEFELAIDAGGVLKGEASEELTAKYMADQAFKEQLLLKPVRAFIKHSKTIRAGRVLREQDALKNLEPLPENYGRF